MPPGITKFRERVTNSNRIPRQNGRSQLTCGKCGKVFTKPINLRRHYNRKYPCTIQDIPPIRAADPIRCIYCNKFFSTKGSLTRHLKICKHRDADADTVTHNHAIMLKMALDRIALLEANDTAVAANITNTTNNTINVTSITITNNYLMPNVSYIFDTDVFRNTYRTQMYKTPMILIPLIWFNPDHPENISAYLSNKATREVCFYDEGWKKASIDTIVANMRTKTCDMICDAIPGIDTTPQFIKHYPTLQCLMREAMYDEGRTKEDSDALYYLLVNAHEMVKQRITA